MSSPQKPPAPSAATDAGVMNDGRVITIQPPPQTHTPQPRRWIGRSTPDPELPRYEPGIELPSYQESQRRNAQETTPRRRPTAIQQIRRAAVPPRSNRKASKCCWCGILAFLLFAIAMGGYLMLRPHPKAKKASTHDEEEYDYDDPDGSRHFKIVSDVEQRDIPLVDVDGMLESSQDVVPGVERCLDVFHDPSCDFPDVQVPPALVHSDPMATATTTAAQATETTIEPYPPIDQECAECRSVTNMPCTCPAADIPLPGGPYLTTPTKEEQKTCGNGDADC